MLMMEAGVTHSFVDVGIDGVVVHREDVGVAVVVHSALIVNLQVGLSVETLKNIHGLVKLVR